MLGMKCDEDPFSVGMFFLTKASFIIGGGTFLEHFIFKTGCRLKGVFALGCQKSCAPYYKHALARLLLTTRSGRGGHQRHTCRGAAWSGSKASVW